MDSEALLQMIAIMESDILTPESFRHLYREAFEKIRESIGKADKFDYLINHFQGILDVSSRKGDYNKGFTACLELVIDYMKN